MMLALLILSAVKCCGYNGTFHQSKLRRPRMSHDNNKNAPSISDESIAQRAYHIWQSRGCPLGDGSTDWEIAEQQLERESRGALGSLRRVIARLRTRAA
jgi:hypothetical protein